MTEQHSPVVYISGRPCKRRKNHADDGPVIERRFLMVAIERAAFADKREDTFEERSTALCLMRAAEDQLPRNNLRLLVGTLDLRTDFKVRLAELDIVRAEREAYKAKWLRAYHLNGGSVEEADAAFPDRELHFGRLRHATEDLARSPALTRLDLRAKQRAIGSIWLQAEGAWYDQLRAAVAEDEARLERARQC